MSLRYLFEAQLERAAPIKAYLEMVGCKTVNEAVSKLRQENVLTDAVTLKKRSAYTKAKAKQFVEERIATHEKHLGQRMVFAMVDDGSTDLAGEKTINISVIKLWEDQLDSLHEKYGVSPMCMINPPDQVIPRLVELK